LHPQVIITNYVMSRPNCLETSRIYAVCCRNQCEEMVARLESDLQTTLAEPTRIADLVSTFSSDTVQAPRKLGTELVSRLEQVAAQHHGQVPIHGRLFAQWMHHAFPRECPYPHQSRSIAQLTPDAWMYSSGESDAEATMQEMQETVDSAVCEVDDQGIFKGPCMEDESLPWSDDEELLGGSSATLQISKGSAAKLQGKQLDRLAIPIAVAVSLMMLSALILDYRYARKHTQSNKQEVLYVNQVSASDLKNKSEGLKKVAGLWTFACIAWACQLPDAGMLIVAVCSYIVFSGVRTLSSRKVPKQFA